MTLKFGFSNIGRASNVVICRMSGVCLEAGGTLCVVVVAKS